MNDEIKRIDEFKNTNEFKTIQNLLDKYMDGATSNEEEATLRKYFEEHGNDIPEEWESYRALFSYIGFEQMNLSQILKGSYNWAVARFLSSARCQKRRSSLPRKGALSI